MDEHAHGARGSLAAATALSALYELYRATAKAGVSRHDSMRTFLTQALPAYALVGVLAAFLIGHALWVLIELRPSAPWAASDVWGWEQWGIFLLTLLPTAIGAAVLGALGGWIRRAAIPVPRVPA